MQLQSEHIGIIEHALNNQNRFYSEANDKAWNELVESKYATKHPGWEDTMAYFSVTAEGKKALSQS